MTTATPTLFVFNAMFMFFQDGVVHARARTLAACETHQRVPQILLAVVNIVGVVLA